MKKLLALLTTLLLTTNAWTQSPEKMSYQAVIRNASDVLLKSTKVGMRISILQGGTSGTAVYVETQTPSTNANGLVSISIGAGTVVTGSFAAIDWSKGIFFIKTETDLKGGTNYTITGTSQLLSVPYALHAKTAESVTGSINETDPVFATSQAINITINDIINLSKLSGTNTGDQDLSELASKIALTDSTAKVRGEIPKAADGTETKLAAGTHIALTGTGSQASPYTINLKPLAIGDNYQGGKIFWLDASGQHGLISAIEDQVKGIAWANTSTTTNASRDGIRAGMYNTERIIMNQGEGIYAAQTCIWSMAGDYGDWYLPSRVELVLMRQQMTKIGPFSDGIYWSSSEINTFNASVIEFPNETLFDYSKSEKGYVRCIRSF